MSSVVASAFRDCVLAGLSEDQAELLNGARGDGPEHRETNRALMLGDRAAREWAASAISEARPGAPNQFETLPLLGKPEDAYHLLQPAARDEVHAAGSGQERSVAEAVVALADALPLIDTEATAGQNRAAFVAVGRSAAQVLLAAAAILGSETWAVDQANEALRDLPGLAGWTNHLGPRFE